MLETYVEEFGSTGDFEMSWRHGLSAGKSWHPPTLAPMGGAVAAGEPGDVVRAGAGAAELTPEPPIVACETEAFGGGDGVGETLGPTDGDAVTGVTDGGAVTDRCAVECAHAVTRPSTTTSARCRICWRFGS